MQMNRNRWLNPSLAQHADAGAAQHSVAKLHWMSFPASRIWSAVTTPVGLFAAICLLSGGLAAASLWKFDTTAERHSLTASRAASESQQLLVSAQPVDESL